MPGRQQVKSEGPTNRSAGGLQDGAQPASNAGFENLIARVSLYYVTVSIFCCFLAILSRVARILVRVTISNHTCSWHSLQGRGLAESSAMPL